MLTEKDKNKVLAYLKDGEEIAVAPGYVQNHVTGSYTRIELVAYSDGTFDWTSEDIYNLEVNNEIFHKKLIKHILKN